MVKVIDVVEWWMRVQKVRRRGRVLRRSEEGGKSRKIARREAEIEIV